MINLIFSFLLSSNVGAGIMHRVADRVISVRVTAADDPDQDPGDSADSDSETDPDSEDLEVVPPAPPTGGIPGGIKMPVIPPIPPMPKNFKFEFKFPGEGSKFSESGKNVPTVELLHRIAQTAGWSMTVVGSPKDTVDVDFKNADVREALRQVLKQAGALGVLKKDKLVVVATPDSHSVGMLIEKMDAPRDRHAARAARRAKGHDMVRVFQGDLTVPGGQLVQGDVVCVGGSIELEPGAVVQGDAVSVGGSVTVNEGALVMGQAVAVLGSVDVARGAQVMGEHVQVGIGKLFGHHEHTQRGWLTSLGPFGLFPTVALFALIYLLGLVTLRMWPERVRNVGFALFENPVRSFTVGFLCWLLLLPLVVLLCISIVGIPLVPLLPVIIFLSIVIGLSSFALRIGEALPAGPGQRFVPPAALGMGMTVLMLVAFVPWLGISILALLQFFALGASVGSRFGRALPPHQP